MRVREEETWEEYRDHWLEYERHKADLRLELVEQRATGTDGGAGATWRPQTASEYEDAIRALCLELRL